MNDHTDSKTGPSPSAQTSGDALAAAQAARKKRWDRITLAVIVAMLAAFAAAVVFRQELRANYWAWQLRRADAPDQRQLWAAALATAGPAAYAPAIRLTRGDDPAVRQAGMRVLIDLLWAAKAEQSRAAPDAQRPIHAPGVAERFIQLLDDADRQIRSQAMDGLVLLGERAALPRLIELARDDVDSETAMKALAALADIDPAIRDDPKSGRQAAETLRHVLAESDDPNVRTQAIDCLRHYPSDATLTALVDALADLRPVTVPPQSEQIPPEMAAWLEKEMQRLRLEAGQLAPPATQPHTAPAVPPDRPRTVADYADRALRHLTGQDFGFDATAPRSDRDAVIQRWREFIARKRA